MLRCEVGVLKGGKVVRLGSDEVERLSDKVEW